MKASRLDRSLESVKRGERPRFADGRCPMYFGLLDLPSRPVLRAEECDGVPALLRDLAAHHELLLAEALKLRGVAKDMGAQSNGGWRVALVAVDGALVVESAVLCPTLITLLGRHPCVIHMLSFGACLISFLDAGGIILPHSGPVNFKARLQYPLTSTASCTLSCGDETSTYNPEDTSLPPHTIIDDSYVHHARNDGHAGERIVLIVDVWHPGVLIEERERIIALLNKAV